MPEPAEIQRQIEQTRAELASTIDAIADRVSPKRVASRSVETVKAKVEDLRSKGTAQPIPATSRPALPAGASDGQQPLPARVASSLREARDTRGRSVRWDRVGMVAGAAAVLRLIAKRRKRSKTASASVIAKTAAAQKTIKQAGKKSKKKAAKKRKK